MPYSGEWKKERACNYHNEYVWGDSGYVKDPRIHEQSRLTTEVERDKPVVYVTKAIGDSPQYGRSYLFT